MTKLLIISPHFSTGGAPAVTLNKVKLLKDHFDIMVVEYSFLSWQFVVQRNEMIALMGDNFKSLDKKEELLQIINSWNPDIISMEEFPEMFMASHIADWIYRIERPYRILETTHDSSFKPSSKRYMPDKFVFVSAFNAIRYSHLDIPFEIIEYPVDEKKQRKIECRTKLGLEADYKHVVIIGLFTPRKNQKYAFEIAEKTTEYKIKFHFLGNQADNFADYWKPLVEKYGNLKNCVLWGERGDVDDFMNAADLFLFPSKGDRNNKELNPIVIKEAIQYTELPKLMYNLDVYLNKYSIENVHYLSSNIEQDTQKVIELTGAKKISNELIIVGTYPNLKSRVKLTKDTIQSLKPLGRKILLVSHYPVDEETQRMVDFYIFDAHNPLCHHSYYTRFYRTTDEYYAEININGLKDSNQSLTVLTNMYNAAKFAKNAGFDSFFYTTYDVVLKEQDISVVESGFEFVSGEAKAYLGTLDTPFGKGIQTNGMFFNTDFFLETFDDVRTSEAYNEACAKIGSHNFLEDYLKNKLKDGWHTTDVTLVNNQEGTLLKHSGLGVASNSEYYSILPVEDNKYMFYFYTYNIDNRQVIITIKEQDAEIYSHGFYIDKTREFKHEIEYKGKEIEVGIQFYDGDNCYKNEKYVINSHNIEKYNNTGSFKWNKKPKIKLVHIQTTLNDERERKSRASLREVEKHGIEYILHRNEPYKDLPPKFNCLRPQCVSAELFDEDTLHKLGTALTPAHYGCYEAFKNAILTEFEDCDYLIVCEGDCIIEKPIEEFCNAVFEAARLCKENNIGFFSFGDTHTLEHGWLQSPVIKEIPNQDLMFITNHLIGIQCVMFPKFVKKWLKESFRLHKWDAADIFLNTIFKISPYQMGIVKKRLTTQADGYSLIDQQEKIFIK